MNGNKVLVTGGFGNLGSYIVKHLISLNYEVTILTRSEKYKFENLKYRVIECDIVNLEELKIKLNDDFDFCIHCASFNESLVENYPKKALEINTLGTRNLLESLNLKKLKNFVYFSTVHVYGLNNGIIDENTQTNPKNDYALSHLFAEYYIKQFGYTYDLHYTILRLTNSYGTPIFKNTDKWYLVLNDLTKSAYEQGEIRIKSNGKAKRDFISMLDVVEIISKLLQIDATNDIYNLSSNKTDKIIELAKKVKKVYENIYNKSIKITINENDKNIYDDLKVDNQKLKKIVSFESKDRIAYEINQIFVLLENLNE